MLLYLIVGSTIVIGCSVKQEAENKKLKGKYLGQTAPSDSAEIFADKLISTQFNERDMAFSPDGNEFFYSLKGSSVYSLINVKRIDGVWEEKRVASFSGKYSDLEPCFSPDGTKLFFVSNRPVDNSVEPKDYDIWYVEKTDNGWGAPINPGAPLNSTANEFYPSFTNDGTIYFCARTEIAIGGEDLYYSKFIDGKYQDPVNLGDSINTARDEFNAFVSPDGQFIIYTSTGWGAGFGGGDLWISFKNKNDEWTKPKNMSEKVNSPFLEFCPSLTPDGKYLFFTSSKNSAEKYSPAQLSFDEIIGGLQSTVNGSQNIYWISTDFIKSLYK